jgi:hypothetical protein
MVWSLYLLSSFTAPRFSRLSILFFPSGEGCPSSLLFRFWRFSSFLTPLKVGKVKENTVSIPTRVRQKENLRTSAAVSTAISRRDHDVQNTATRQASTFFSSSKDIRLDVVCSFVNSTAQPRSEGSWFKTADATEENWNRVLLVYYK